ncbi:phasin family protein [Escherichia coli]|nr:phasin family protein [Escherichia coli]MIL09841.1 phasin family protein [Salmonella enterica subsp. enterica serovar Enteritidis]
MAKTFDAGQFGQDYLDNSLKTIATLSKGLQAIAIESTDYAKKSYESGSAAFEKLTSAKSLEAAVEIQTTYAKSAYEAFVAQATKLGELYADLGKEIYQPFETLAAKAK